jgi:hypothetical protein
MCTCEICNSKEGEYTLNPFDLEINGMEIWQYICTDCYNDLCGDI